MSFQQTLFRILQRLQGGSPVAPIGVLNSTPQYGDSKEILALKWELHLS